MNKLEIAPIGYISNSIHNTGGHDFHETESSIILSDSLPAHSFQDLAIFSHLEIVFYFNLHKKNEQHNQENKSFDASSATNNKKDTSMLFGTSIVKLIGIEGKMIHVKGLDAINGTAVIDIKPVMNEFLPSEEVKHPDWIKKISGNY